MTLIKSISGIRGTIGGQTGDNLTPLDVVKFTAAFGTIIKNQEKSKNVQLWLVAMLVFQAQWLTNWFAELLWDLVLMLLMPDWPLHQQLKLQLLNQKPMVELYLLPVITPNNGTR